MNSQQFLLILWARRWLVLAVFCLTVLATIVVSLLLPKQYLASVSIVVDVKADPIAGMVLPSVASLSYMTTQSEIIQSERVATRVVKMLQIEKSPAAIESWKEATDGKVPFEYYYGNLLLRSLAVKPSRGSNIIGLMVSGTEPQFVAAVANAFAQAYIDTSIELRVDPARQYAAWFDERLKSLRSNLENAQAKLSSFQQERGIVAADVRLDEEIAKLAALNAQLSSVQGQKVETSIRQSNTGSEYSPDVMQNSLILGLKSSLAQAEAKLTEISSIVGSNHPQRKALDAQIAGLKAQLQDEISRISSGAATASRVSNQQESKLKALIEVQKKRVLDLRSGHDEIFVLTQDVETAQRAYEGVAKRATELSLESKSEQANLSVLSPAIPPSEPAKPNLAKNIFGAVGAGLLLSIMLAIGIEMLDRRVRNAKDLEQTEGIPVLGTLRLEKRRMSPRARLAMLWNVLRFWRRNSALRAAT
jgi:chain length determinant protein EpsF